MKTLIILVALLFAINISNAEEIKKGKTEIVMFKMDDNHVEILFKNQTVIDQVHYVTITYTVDGEEISRDYRFIISPDYDKKVIELAAVTDVNVDFQRL